MTQPLTLPRLPVPLSPRRGPAGVTPSGCKVLHVILREEIFNRAKAQAYLSGMPFPEFVALLLAQTGPIPKGTPPLLYPLEGTRFDQPAIPAGKLASHPATERS